MAAILAAIESFAEADTPQDDITLVVVRVL
jgi:serine phosphatase RsbU (regulator of sigma subunit)